MQYKTQAEIIERANQLIGVPFSNFDKDGILQTGKGAVGNVIQQGWFNIPINNSPEPDFVGAGIELKAHPFRYNKKNEVVAKERLVCDIIDYMQEYKKNFETSSFYLKCKKMLLLPYEDKIGIPKSKFSVAKAFLFEFPLEDLKIIKDDWEKIIDKIRNGKAEEISEGDTMYLGACTKGATSSTVRKQPHSTVMAKQRAYCLKQPYITYILQNYIFGYNNNSPQSIVKDINELQNKTFEEYVVGRINEYKNKTLEELKKLFNISTTSKDLMSLIAFNILGLKSNKAEEFIKSGIVVKTIRIGENNKIKEHMSFPYFKFREIVNEEWEEAYINKYLSSTKFLFVVFKECNQGYILKGCQFWNIPYSDLENEVKSVWYKTKNVVMEGNSFKMKNGKNCSDLPKQKNNFVCHVRPHCRDSFDTDILPNGHSFPKQCFWLNNKYVYNQISETLK